MSAMSVLAIASIAMSIVFLLIGFVMWIRLKEAKGSLRLAKISIIMSMFSAAATSFINILSQLVYEQLASQGELLVKQLHVPLVLFAMLVLAFMASFAVFATYSGGKRKLIVALIFVVALIPAAYLTFNYQYASVAPAQADSPESYQLTVPTYTLYLYALCGIPLGLIPLVAFGRSLVMARRRGDKVLSNRAAVMLISIFLNEVMYFLFAFFTEFVELVAIVAWIPIALLLLSAFLRITSSLEPKG